MSIKTPMKIVGFERPGLAFPEDAKDFFAKQMGNRFLHHQLTDRLIESVKMEGLRLLSIAKVREIAGSFDPNTNCGTGRVIHD